RGIASWPPGEPGASGGPVVGLPPAVGSAIAQNAEKFFAELENNVKTASDVWMQQVVPLWADLRAVEAGDPLVGLRRVDARDLRVSVITTTRATGRSHRSTSPSTGRCVPLAVRGSRTTS